jgi:hypothetical protein
MTRTLDKILSAQNYAESDDEEISYTIQTLDFPSRTTSKFVRLFCFPFIYIYIVTDKTSIARQRLVKNHCRATLGKKCLKAGILKSIA